MRRRWVRRGAITAGLSVAVHLLLLAGVPLGSPGARTDRSRQVSEVALVPVPVPVTDPPPPPPRAPQEVRPAAMPTREELAPFPWDAVRDEPAPQEPSPPPAPTVEVVPPPSREPTGPEPLPDLPSPREAAQRMAVTEPPEPSREERLGARVDALLRESLPPRDDDRSPMPELRPDGEGNLIHEDGALYAKISPDGSVTFGRRRGVSVDELHRGGKSPDPIEQEIRDLHTTLPGVPLTVFKAPAGDCGGGGCDDAAGLGLTIRPNSDLNDLVLRAKGEDPLAAKKRRFLRLTEELRDQLATRYEEANQRRAKVHASRNLERLWSDADLDFAAKRRLLFELWEECEEATGPGGEDPAVADAGQEARDHIVAFIRRRLPPGSPEAYTPAELRRLNATRTSRQAFAPY